MVLQEAQNSRPVLVETLAGTGESQSVPRATVGVARWCRCPSQESTRQKAARASRQRAPVQRPGVWSEPLPGASPRNLRAQSVARRF